MSTIQVVQQPYGNGNGANGSGGNGHVPCPRDKKPFATKVEAEQFEAENRKRFGRQHAYKCDDCPAYHLTSKPPDAYAIGQTNLKRLEDLAKDTVAKPSGKRGRRGDTEAEVKRLWEQGGRDAEIASQLGISSAAVCYHRKKFGAANSRMSRNSPRQPKAPLTLLEFDEQKRLLQEEYQAKLVGLEQHKQRLVEASKLTVIECEEGKSVYIKFGHQERMVVPKDKVSELASSLMQWV